MAKRRDSEAAERRRERWRQTLQQWRSSGLSQAEFCRRRGVAVWKLSWWKRRLSGEPIGPPAEFIPLGVVHSPARRGRLEVVLTNGRRLRFGMEIEPEKLACLAAALDGGGVEIGRC